jgi:hypothetical protein
MARERRVLWPVCHAPARKIAAGGQALCIGASGV